MLVENNISHFFDLSCTWNNVRVDSLNILLRLCLSMMLNNSYIAQACITADCTKTGEADPAPTSAPAPEEPEVPVDMECDIGPFLEYFGYYGFTLTGRYQLRFPMDGKLHVSRVTCNANICTPTNPGPTNACVYICGRTTCP